MSKHLNLTEQMDKRQLELARIRLVCRLHAMVLDAVLQCGVDETFIASRLGQKPEWVKRWLDSPFDITLDRVSDILVALAADLDEPKWRALVYRSLEAEAANYRKYIDKSLAE